MCFSDQHLQSEFKHVKNVFRDINGYPNWITEKTIEQVKNLSQMSRSTQVTTNTGKKRTFADVTL